MNSTQTLPREVALIADRERTMERIYAQTYPMVRHYIREQGGSEEDAKDIFHEAMIVFYEKTALEQLTLTCSVSTYLMGICKNLWRQQVEKQRRKTAWNETQTDLVWEEPEDENELPALKLMGFVEQLGETCQSILVSFYYFGQRLEQIATQHGYRSVRSATVQKFKCLERLRKAVSHLSIGHFKS
ncbi:RNA polymerase sigma factor [Larkinella humicola]|uniref:Sigma-70 family RNA polymerase sigma factor n=1 Tax=Larkinella humicola TaxID=2607654 RepID=A0A5N1JRY2_9BACT|nr:sigma-70 family RNA polymerase sigma factor [Larkinella humicola]KAA9357072.1 sigma-70 family RNA polymerase sigma factor [Larkinella humicola]